MSQVIPPDPGHIGWIAPLSICVLLFIGNGGYGTLIWVVMAELLPPRLILICLSLSLLYTSLFGRVRATANAIVICMGFILGFVMSKTFVDLINAIHARYSSYLNFKVSGNFSHKSFFNRITVLHDSGTFWLYGAVCLVGSFYTIFFVPETKGKTIEEIQQMFSASPEEIRKGAAVTKVQV